MPSTTPTAVGRATSVPETALCQLRQQPHATPFAARISSRPAGHRPTTFLSPAPTTYVPGFNYAPHGAVAQLTLGNGLTESAQFNNRLQPSQLQATHPISGTLLTLGFGFGNANNGNVISQSISHPGFAATQIYAYDDVNRLASVTEGAWSRSYSYDAYGNRAATGQDVSGATPQLLSAFTPTNNRITAANYDDAGNLESLAGLAALMTYDANNKMTSFEGPTALQEEGAYSYDGHGNRIRRVSTIAGATTNTTFVYDAFGQLAAEYSDVAPQPADVGTFYRTTDHLGSTRLVSKADGTAKRCYDFYPFGESIPNDLGGRSGESCYGGSEADSFKQKFTGKERDDESDMDYFLARYYAGPLGRFLNPDRPFADQSPLNPQSWNLYNYVRGNPLRFFDPTGRTCVVNGDGSTETVDDGGETCEDVEVDNSRDPSKDPEAVEAEVTDKSPGLIDTLFSPPVPRFVENDRPLNSRAQEVVSSIDDNAGNLGRAADRVAACAAESLGIKTAIGAGLVGAGQPVIPTRGKFGGATPGTSPASVASRNIPGKLPRGIRFLGTNKIGGAIGRTLPFVGAGLLALNVVETVVCVATQ